MSVHYFAAKQRKSKYMDVLFRNVWYAKLLVWILRNVKSKETIVVYHSLGYMGVIALAHRIRKFRLILEVEEIYADVIGSKRIRQKEINFFKRADGYIFPTKLLSDMINGEQKPEAIIHGTYRVEPERECLKYKDDLQDGAERIIHCIYAGTFDPRKGGAIAAANATEYLTSRYHMHIIGFGSNDDVANMQDTIDRISTRSKAKITYDGLLSGEEYIRFIQDCDIGLSTQNPDAAFNGTSFPSKILSYMANGLRVVSIRIPAVEQSDVGNLITYYDKQTPEEIAKAIQSVDFEKTYHGRGRIQDLDEKFRRELANLLDDSRRRRCV